MKKYYVKKIGLRVHVHFRNGSVIEFVVPSTMTMDDFIKITKVHGVIKSVEFPE